jgi:CopG family nickel-responsive transcriptional regulator
MGKGGGGLGMSELIRVGISLPAPLLESYDHLIAGHGYTNRSEAIRDLIRERLVAEEWSRGGEVAGTFTLVYDHHHRELVARLLNVQHDHERAIVSTLHVHLDHDNCLEVLVLRGQAKELRVLTDALRSLRGVKHTTLAMTSTGKELT